MTTVPLEEESPLGGHAHEQLLTSKRAADEGTDLSAIKQAADTPLEGSAKRIKLTRGPLSPKAHDTEMTEPESEDDSLFGDEEELEDFRHQLADKEEKPQTLSEAELVERRLKHIQDLYKVYKVEYWGLLEEFRTRHKVALEKQQLKSSWRLPSEAEKGLGKDVTAETSVRQHFRQATKRKAPREAEHKHAGPATSEQAPQEGKGPVNAEQPAASNASALASVPADAPAAQQTASAPDSVQDPPSIPAVSPAPPQQAGAAQIMRRNSGGSQSASPPGADIPLDVHNPFSPFTTMPPGDGGAAAEDSVGALGDDVRGYGSDEDPATFSDAEAAVLSGAAGPGAASTKTLQAWRAGYRRSMQMLTRLEQAASGCTARELDRAGAMAVLCGRHNRFLIKRSAVSLGRTTDAAGEVDIDLTSEGDARKVSRQQAHLSLRADGRFQLRNIGRRTLFVNNRQVDQGQVAQLRHLSLIEVGGVRLLFMVNHAALRRASTRSAGLAMYCDPWLPQIYIESRLQRRGARLPGRLKRANRSTSVCKMARALAYAFLAFVGVSTIAALPSYLDIQAPITVPLQDGMRSNSTSIDLNDPSLPGAGATGTMPTEVHLSPAGPGSLYVHWATNSYKVGKGALTPNDPTSVASIVKYGTSPSALSSTASGTAEIYNQIYNTSGTWKGGDSALNYTSPILHTAIMSGLKPDTEYYYVVGDGTTFSNVYNFTSLQAPGPNYPQRILAIADWGASHNSTVTLQHIVDSAADSDSPPVVFYIADFCYADTWYANGTASLPTSGFEGRQSSTYQPVWDTWQRMIEPLVSKTPMLTCTGNHEIEEQDDANNTIFASVQARWKVPSNASVVPSPSYFFYSSEFGPVHAIFLSVYVNYLPGSDQWNWLSKDLLSINRTVTPWVTVSFHNPWYTTDSSYKEFEQMRVSIEPLLYAAGADVVFYGHVHAYERSYPVYNYNIDPCGTTHITIGDGGNTEGLSFLNSNKTGLSFEDYGVGCSNTTGRVSYLQPTNPTVSDPWTYYARTLTFQGDGNSTGLNNPAGFCYKEQPAWSAYREPSFGHGVLDIMNGTHALWMWHRNQDNEAVAADEFYIVRDTAACPNKAYPNNRVTNGGMAMQYAAV